jgi:hypothetical protein
MLTLYEAAGRVKSWSRKVCKRDQAAAVFSSTSCAMLYPPASDGDGAVGDLEQECGRVQAPAALLRAIQKRIREVGNRAAPGVVPPAVELG